MFQNEKITDKLPSVSNLEFKSIHKKYLIVLLLNFFFIASIFFVGLFFLIQKNLKNNIPEYTGYLYLFLGLFFSTPRMCDKIYDTHTFSAKFMQFVFVCKNSLFH